MMNNCSNCKYRENIAGDAHIKCGYPMIKPDDRIIISMASLANPEAFNRVVSQNFGFTVSESALLSGYFHFPENFDPTWMMGDCQKHSNLIGDTVRFQMIMEKSLMRHTIMTIGVSENKIEETNEIKTSIKMYEEALEFIKTQSPENMDKERSLKIRDEFERMLKEADFYFEEQGFLKKFKSMPEFQKQNF